MSGQKQRGLTRVVIGVKTDEGPFQRAEEEVVARWKDRRVVRSLASQNAEVHEIDELVLGVLVLTELAGDNAQVDQTRLESSLQGDHPLVTGEQAREVGLGAHLGCGRGSPADDRKLSGRR